MDMLKHYHDDPKHQRYEASDDSEGNLYIIDRIVDRRHKSDRTKYLVQWKGFDEHKNTWEPAEQIEEDASRAVEGFFFGMMDDARGE